MEREKKEQLFFTNLTFIEQYLIHCSQSFLFVHIDLKRLSEKQIDQALKLMEKMRNQNEVQKLYLLLLNVLGEKVEK